MRMTWSELLFAHWPFEPDLVARTLPAGLALDTFEGRAWLGVVPFRMSGVRLAGLPSFGVGERFPELNLRTYVTHGGKPGVWFYSLDAASPLAVAGARGWFNLPYFTARMSCESRADTVHYRSMRTHSGAPAAELLAQYRPTSVPRRASRGSLESWLTDRYCLYTLDHSGRLTRGEIDHAPWPLQDAEAHLERCTLAQASGFTLPDQRPLLHYVQSIDVAAWSPVLTDAP
jgi:uncharacterized protein YqjF (DUF2071 family)